jgi:hypothetical protein
MTTLPTSLSPPIPPDDNIAYHNTMHAALAELGLPTGLVSGAANHPEHHEALQAFFRAYGVALDVTGDVTTGHTNAHNRLHAYCNILTRAYGPNPSYTKPSGATDVAVGDLTQTLLNNSTSGTKFWLLAGIHRPTTELLIPNAKTFEFHGQPGAIWKGSKVLSGWTASGSDWFVGGQTQRFTATGGVTGLSGFPFYNNPEDLWFDGVFLERVASQAALGPGKWFFDLATDRIYVRDDPAGHLVETTAIPAWIRNPNGSGGVKVQNISFQHCGNATETGAIDDIAEVRDCEITGAHGNGILLWTGLATGCRIHHNGQMGKGGGGSIEDSEVAYNNVAGISPYFSAGHGKTAFANGYQCRRVWSHHNRGPGPWLDISNLNCVVEDCISEDQDMGGFVDEISGSATEGTIYQRNIARRNGQGEGIFTLSELDHNGIAVASSRGVRVRNNSCYDQHGGILGMHTTNAPGLHDLDVNNNWVSQSGGWTGIWVDGAVADPTAAYTSQNNHFTSDTYRQAAGNWWRGATNTQKNFAGWQGDGFDTAGSHIVESPDFDRQAGFTDDFADGLTEQRWNSRYWRQSDGATRHVRGQGYMRPAASAFAIRYVTARTKPAADAEVLALVRRADALTEGALNLILRADAAVGAPSVFYQLQLGCAGATDSLFLGKNSGGGYSTFATVTTGLTHGTAYWLRWRLVGTQHQVRVWADGTSEPGSWTLTTTDSAVTAAGRLACAAENGAAGNQTDARFDQLTYTLL